MKRTKTKKGKQVISNHIDTDFKRLNTDVLMQIMSRMKTKPSASYYSPEVHFATLEEYCSKIPVQQWRNLFSHATNLPGGQDIYRTILVKKVGKSFNPHVVHTNSKALINTWFATKMEIHKKTIGNELPLVTLDMDDSNRFLYLTVGFMIKCYGNKYAGRKVSQQRRAKDVGDDIENAYKETKRQLPNLWILKLLPYEDNREYVYEYSDAEGDDTPLQPEPSVNEPIDESKKYTTYNQVKNDLEIKNSSLKRIKLEMMDLAQKKEGFEASLEQLIYERDNLNMLKKSVLEREAFVAYYNKIPEHLLPSNTRGDELISMVDPLKILKDVIETKNINIPTATLLQAWIETIRAKDPAEIIVDLEKQLENMKNKTLNISSTVSKVSKDSVMDAGCQSNTVNPTQPSLTGKPLAMFLMQKQQMLLENQIGSNHGEIDIDSNSNLNDGQSSNAPILIKIRTKNTKIDKRECAKQHTTEDRPSYNDNDEKGQSKLNLSESEEDEINENRQDNGLANQVLLANIEDRSDYNEKDEKGQSKLNMSESEKDEINENRQDNVMMNQVPLVNSVGCITEIQGGIGNENNIEDSILCIPEQADGIDENPTMNNMVGCITEIQGGIGNENSPKERIPCIPDQADGNDDQTTTNNTVTFHAILDESLPSIAEIQGGIQNVTNTKNSIPCIPEQAEGIDKTIIEDNPKYDMEIINAVNSIS